MKKKWNEKKLEKKPLVHLFFFYFLVSFPMDPTFPFPITFLLRCFISIWINGCRFSVAISFLSVVFHSLFSWVEGHAATSPDRQSPSCVNPPGRKCCVAAYWSTPNPQHKPERVALPNSEDKTLLAKTVSAQKNATTVQKMQIGPKCKKTIMRLQI